MTKTIRRSRETGKIDPSVTAGEATIASNSFAVTLFRGIGKAYSVRVGFTPSFTWIKNRVQADSHKLVDSVRGLTKVVVSNAVTAEATDSTGLLTFDANTFTLGSGVNGFNDIGEDFVGYAWNESTANGFDIVAYTGTGASRTINHDLGVIPNLIIIKNRSSGTSWAIYHGSISTPNTRSFGFNSAIPTTTTFWNNTQPTETQFSVGTDSTVNTSGSSYIAYVFAAVTGKSAFGTYTGNANVIGPTVNIGFQPKLVIIRRVDAIGSWQMIDSLRGGNRVLDSGSTTGETTATLITFLSNGFQPITTSSTVNSSTGTYTYSAWA